MDEREAPYTDGPRDEGTRTFLAGERLHLNAEARQQLNPVQAPILLDEKNPHARLFVAAMDGTGNDFIHDPEHATNVGLIYDQIRAGGNGRIEARYVEGSGTQQDRVERILDGARGDSAMPRAEHMYQLFIDQAGQWKQDDPNAQISLAGLGFSRGGEEVALLTRLVEERGIQDPLGAVYTYDAHHQITRVEYAQPPLVAPGETAQVVVLFDPVGTGKPMHEDRRLPPSVISGLQLNAMDELRRLFKSDHIIDPGISPDGRFIGLNLAGAHSDVGGGYRLNGLSNSAGGLGIAYLNALSSRPYLHELQESDDPQRNVIHRSEDGLLLYGFDYKVDRSTPNGYNERLVDQRMAAHVVDPDNAEPRNEKLNARFVRQTVSEDLRSPLEKSPVDLTQSDLDKLIDRLYQGALHSDAKAMDAVTRDYLRTPHGQAWQQQVMQSDPVLPVPVAVRESTHPPAAQQAPVM
ncbi:MAG: DUF2235 domain-containing protein [Rhodanobacter sp.]